MATDVLTWPGVPEAPSSTTVEAVYVDLDGTLVRTDLLHEGLIQAVKHRPACLVSLARAFAQGRSEFKAAVAAEAQPDPAMLPYREDVLTELRRLKGEGKRIVLATASPRPWAEAVAAHVQVFEAVLASEPNANLKGRRKLVAIKDDLRQQGLSTFAYWGDSSADLPIWEAAQQRVAVAPSRRVREELPAGTTVVDRRGSRVKPLLKALRPHQWAKNCLIFVPLVLAHAFAFGTIVQSLVAFAAFSLCASAVYVLNDLLDVESDRKHPKKRERPFAAGKLPLSWGPAIAGGMVTVGLGLAAFLPAAFFGALVFYLALTSVYSFWLKKKLILDVVLLSGLYTLRIIAGGLATGLPVSEWLMAFSVFLFTSLAFAKRHAELSRLVSEGKTQPSGRGYLVEDLGIIESIGASSGYLAVLVLALYINSDAMKHVYARPWPLWLICLTLLYWVTRLWFVTKRGLMSEDPVVFALKDSVSRMTGVVVLVLALVASLPLLG